ncbi:hypothetical protein G6F36_013552 [Rhizopus arrhizus]|nr:hypothetical protein G6F36_013552 [Rhizopus arrhizus]
MSENSNTESLGSPTSGPPTEESSSSTSLAVVNTKPTGSMASKYAHEPTPMEEGTPVLASPVIATKPDDIVGESLHMIESMKKKVLVLFSEYMNADKFGPDSKEAMSALSSYKQFEQKITAAEDAHKSFISMFQEKSAPPAQNNSLVRLVVPTDLPSLQLRVLHAHGLPLNTNWEHLLPLCMNPEQVSWCREALMDRNWPWKEVRPRILDHFDTPYRKFLLMVEVGSMRQAPYESNGDYSNRFQKMRREAGMEDGTQLAVAYFASLKPSVKTVAQVAISSHLGAKLPNSINQIIDLVLASGEDSAFSIKNPYKRNRGSEEELVSRVSFIKTNKVSPGTSKVANGFKSNNISTNKGITKPKPCIYCGKEWSKGHRCEEFKEAKKSSSNAKANEGFSLSRVNRMAIRSNNDEKSNDDEDVTNGHLNRMALD